MTLVARPTAEPEVPRPHRFTADEYLGMDRLGYFEGKRVELVDGEILDVSPQQPPHRRAVTRCFWVARNAYNDPSSFFVVSQGTLRLGEDMPEPDLYVLPCGEETPEVNYPLPLWVLEISEVTYPFDTGRKLRMYARHRIPQYLVLDVKRRQIEIYSDPFEEAAGQWSYRSRRLLQERDVFKPDCGPEVGLPVREMLP